MNDDLTRQFEHIAAQADQEAEAQEEAEAYLEALDEMRQVAKAAKDFMAVLIEEGIPASLAHGMVRDQADNYWAESMRRSFRGQR